MNTDISTSLFFQIQVWHVSAFIRQWISKNEAHKDGHFTPKQARIKTAIQVENLLGIKLELGDNCMGML